MKRAYKAILHGDRVEWLDGAPESDGPLPVHVILDKPKPEFIQGRTLLRRERVEWLDDAPTIEEATFSYIVPLKNIRMDHPENSGTIAVAMLEILADKGAFDDIEDPVAWQREIRKDRPLPFRDYDVD